MCDNCTFNRIIFENSNKSIAYAVEICFREFTVYSNIFENQMVLGHLNTGHYLSGISKAFEDWPIWHPTFFRLFKYRTCPVFEFPFILGKYNFRLHVMTD